MGKERARLIDDGLLNWLYRYSRDNRWRVPSWMDYADLVQDGYFLIQMIRIRYPEARTAPHFMSLFKRSFMNYVTDLGRKRTRLHEMTLSDIFSDDDSEAQALEHMFASVDELATLHLLMADAPRAIRAAIDLFMNDDVKLSALDSTTLRKNGFRQTYNQKICHLIGIDSSGINIIEAVHDYLMNSLNKSVLDT